MTEKTQEPPRQVARGRTTSSAETLPAKQSEMPDVQRQDVTAVTAAVARERYELQAQFELARMFPRDLARAVAEIEKTCSLPSFCEKALYAFPRKDKDGKEKMISDASVWMIRELVRSWGNVRVKMQIVAADENGAHIQVLVMDLETGTMQSGEDRFPFKIMRRGKFGEKAKWIDCKDEREIRELVNRRAAIVERNICRKLMPHYIVELAKDCVRATLAKGSVGKAGAVVDAFAKFGVKRVDLEAYLGCSPDDATPEQLAELRTIYHSIKDGEVDATEVFSKDGEMPSMKPSAPETPTVEPAEPGSNG